MHTRRDSRGAAHRTAKKAGDARREVDASLNLPAILYDKRPFKREYARGDMARFMQAASSLSDMKLNELLLQLGNNGPVMDKLRDIVAFRFDVRSRSFQEIALPLLQLLASRKFVESIHSMDVKRVLHVLEGEPMFFRRVRNCIQGETQALAAAGLLEPSVGALADVLRAMVRKLPNAGMDEDIYRFTKEFAAWVEELNVQYDFDAALESLEITLEICVDLVPARGEQSADSVPDYLVRGIRTLGVSRRQAAEEDAVGGFDQGPRHDNDDPNYRNVSVIPTDLEMRCLERPYLPTELPVGSPMESHLDFHFRLLREDVLAQIRRGVQWILRPDILAICMQTKNWTPPRETNVPLLNVATDARLEQLKGSIYRGVMFRISAAQPALKNKNKKSLREFWEREQRYKVGSLVCIASDVKPGRAPGVDDDTFPRYAALGAAELIFATVVESNIADLTSNDEWFTVSLKVLESDKTAEMVTTLTNPNRQNLLMEVRGLFFTAYEPILRTLQLHDSHSISPELQECLFGDETQLQAVWQRKPEYARRLHRYNLQFLVKKNLPVKVDLSDVPVENFTQVQRYLREYQRKNYITLDDSQVDAFAAALTQQVCLIQGPPGTGKSFVGTKIVRGILDQRGAHIGPILCVCYTNHALDQFLEGLIDEGLPLTSIVRVGGRSKSPVLESRSLNLLKQHVNESSEESYRFRKLFRECKELEENVLDDFVEASTTSNAFLNWVKLYKPDEYASIVRLEDEEGFKAQGQNNHEQKKRWKSWERGDELKFEGVDRLWRMSLEARMDLVATWEEEWRETAQDSIKYELDSYMEKVEEAQQVGNARLLRILRKSKVVGITTTGCAIHQALIRALAPEIVVCEEAGEVLEAHLLACLSSATQQLIQIGDHMQLRPILNEYTLSHECPGGRHNLDISMFERIVDQRTDRTTGKARVPGSLVTLDIQRRMRPEICDLIRLTLYQELKDGPNVREYPDTRGFTHNLWFFDHDEPEDSGTLSHTNSFEAELVVELVAYAMKQGYGLDEITILTPYLGQLVLIRKHLNTRNFRFALDEKDVEALHAAGVEESDDSGDDEDKEKNKRETVTNQVQVKSMKECVRLSTVDNFQGNESHLVFISTVRCNDRGNVGFLKTFNRVNVMLSRAKSAMFMLGSASTVRRCGKKAEMFNKVLDILENTDAMGRTIGLQCQKHGTITQVATAREIREKTPDGGCLIKCDKRLGCGHSCPKSCHADDEKHLAGLCLEPCVRRVVECGHFCKARCHEKCRCREVLREYDLPCGHTLRNFPCADTHRGPAAIRCPFKVNVKLPFCQHEKRVSCADAVALALAIEKEDWQTVWRTNLDCNTTCDVMRPEGCGHACQQACGKCLASSLSEPEHVTKEEMEWAGRRPHHFSTCTHPCGRALLCGHSCLSFCHPAGSCPPCEATCHNRCTHSKCSLKCREACPSCADPCTWSCEHGQGKCELPCGSPCTRLPCDERCSNVLRDCGHRCPGLCGEPCLPSEYCRECRKTTKSDEIVDLVMATRLQDHDPDDSPLVLLRCGHCFTIETMDGWMGLADFYEQDQHGKCVRVKPLKAPDTSAAAKACPTCRSPVGGVNRYNRLINLTHLHQSELKYLHKVSGDVVASQAERRQAKENASARNKLIDMFRKSLATPTPTQQVLTKESSRLALLGLDGDSINLNAFRGTMQSRAVLLMGIELLELLVAKIKATVTTPKAATHSFTEGVQTELKMLQLGRESASHRSTHEVRVLGMRLRVAYLTRASLPEPERARLVQEVEDARDALQRGVVPASRELQAQAEQLCDLARRAGQLTKEEKAAIFRVFAKGNDDFAQGFGGRWYQCRNGHPYVITECGGAMQRAQCPECGANIGGEQHRLDATNAPATSFFTS